MIHKRYASLIVILLCNLTVFGQRQKTYFKKENGKSVEIRDSADYIQIVKKQSAGDLYLVSEYYLSGEKRAEGMSSSIEKPLYEGKYISFHKNGNIKQRGTYQKGWPIDTMYHYYPNGKSYLTKIYTDDLVTKKTLEYVLSTADSLGNGMVKNGNGICILYDEQYKVITDSGFVKNGVYDGKWRGNDAHLRITYTDEYENGTFISGTSVNEKGEAVNYSKILDFPEFKGGADEFYKFLRKNVKYPKISRKQKIEGRVLLKFDVGKDGSISNVVVTNSVYEELAAEGIRVLQSSPKWKAGLERGVPVKAVYNIPVTFSLGR